MNKNNIGLIIKNTKYGKGVFADKKIQRGEMIMEFTGKFYTSESFPQNDDEFGDHSIQIGENLYLGPSGMADDYFNHSCAPNAGIKINKHKAFLVAISDISINEEITWDYSTTMQEDDWEMNCECGGKNCRGRIREFKYLPKTIQKRYLDLEIVPEYIKKHFVKTMAKI